MKHLATQAFNLRTKISYKILVGRITGIVNKAEEIIRTETNIVGQGHCTRYGPI